MGFLDGTRPIAIAHRGGTEAAPENSLDAFRNAWRLGFRYLETDVHLTVDGTLVAFHDDRLDRVTDRVGAVAERSAAEVASARIHGTHPIPTLDELLEEFPDARFNIDAKHDEAAEALVPALRRHGALGRVCVGGFSDSRLRRLRAQAGPELCTSAGPREIAAEVARSRLGGDRGGSGVPAYRCLQVPVRHRNVEVVTERLVERAHRRGLQVHVWTIDEPGEMHRLLDLGVDGVMTDLPTVLRTVLERRGEWPGPT